MWKAEGGGWRVAGFTQAGEDAGRCEVQADDTFGGAGIVLVTYEIPEPSILLLLGLAGPALLKRRRI